MILKNKRVRRLLIVFLVFLVSFGFFQVLLAGLPFHYGEDAEMLALALQTPWRRLLTLSLSPFSPHLYRFGAETYFTTRPFETLIYKLSGTIHGFRAAPLYTVKCFLAALVGTALLLLLYQATQSYATSLFGWLFFITAPALYASVRYVHDYEIVSQFFLILTLYFFWIVAEKKCSSLKGLFLVLFCLLFGTLAFHTKETAKTLPLILAGFCLLRHRINFRCFCVLIFFSASILLPFFVQSPESLKSLSLNPAHIYSFLVQNAFGYESGMAPALFTPENIVPGSFLGTFGYFFGWAFLFIIIAGALLRKKVVYQYPFRSLFFFALAWWGAALAGYSLIDRLDDRFLTVSLFPGTVVVFLGLHYSLEKLRATNGHLHALSLVFLIPLLLANSQRNLDHILFARNYHGGWLVAEDKIFRTILQDQEPDRIATEVRIHRYLLNEIPKEILLLVRPLEGWDRPVDFPSLEALKERFPSLYVVSQVSDPFKNQADWRLLAEVSTLTDSLYGRLIRKVKKKSARTLYLYKWEKPKLSE